MGETDGRKVTIAELSTPVAEAVAIMTVIVQGLVDRPQAAVVTALEGSQTVMLEISAAKGDIKRLVGRRGRTANALREIVFNLGSKHGRRFMLDVVDPPAAEATGGNGVDGIGAFHAD